MSTREVDDATANRATAATAAALRPRLLCGTCSRFRAMTTAGKELGAAAIGMTAGCPVSAVPLANWLFDCFLSSTNHHRLFRAGCVVVQSKQEGQKMTSRETKSH